MRSTKSLSSIKRLLGLAPGPAPPHAFGVTAGELVYAGFGRDGRRLALAQYRTEPLPPNTFPPGLLGSPPRDPEAFGERLGALLAQIPAPPREASLVVPDAWLRTAFTDVSELPQGAAERDEVLRWKLKRQVPYRIEELRVRGAEVPARPGQKEARRLLIGYGLETLFAQLEATFAERGLRIGRLTNQGLAALGALAPGLGGPGELVGLALVHPAAGAPAAHGSPGTSAGEAGYTLVFALDGVPVLHRYKAVAAGSAAGSFVGRDLRLTQKLLADQFADGTLGRVLLAAPEDEVATWAVWLEEGLETTVEVLGAPHLVPFADGADRAAPSWRRLAPLLGAAAREVD